MSSSPPVDIAVVGAGPAGLLCGLAAAHAGLSAAIVGPRADPRDGRTAALFDPSITALQKLGVWESVSPSAEPLLAIRLVDATGALLRAPEVTFHAREIGLPAFGYNIPNAALTSALEALLSRRSSDRLVRVVTAGVTDAVVGAGTVALSTAEDERIECRLVAAADGRASPMRAVSGLELDAWDYPQAAVVTTFAHTRPHRGVSTEFHRRTGPLTVVPSPGNQSSLVWVDAPGEAERLAGLSDTAFASELGWHLQGLLGTLSDFSPRRVFPLRGQTAKALGRHRIALIGEAAHVIPPIGAQGLNLSIRDGATLVDVCAKAAARGDDIGADNVLATYDAARRPDITSRIWTVDLLNRSLLSPYLPAHLARGLGLLALATVPPLRRFVMREGVGPGTGLPDILRKSAESLENPPAALDGGAAARA